MFSKATTNPSHPAQPATTPPSHAPQPAPHPEVRTSPRAQKGSSTIGAGMVLEGDISGGGEIQIDGTIKGDVRVEHVTVGEGGQVEGGIYAEAVEVRGRVSGAITAKQVRLYGACHVDGDITHEQLAMETGAFFQGRSLRLQRAAPAEKPTPQPAPQAQAVAPAPTPIRSDSGSLREALVAAPRA
jgi:cytoskeletal protein CcmA (bactofilin family)